MLIEHSCIQGVEVRPRRPVAPDMGQRQEERSK